MTDLARRPNPNPTQLESWRFISKISVLLMVSGIAAIVLLEGCHRAGDDSKKDKKGTNAPVTVVLGKVQQRDFPVYLDGLGTVQAFNTVTIRSRVDGQLKKLGFQEGQDVQAGDLLAQIDPDLYQTQLEQNEAKKLQDEAQLENAKVELKRNADLLAAKIATQEAYDTQKFLTAQLEATVKADQAAIDNARVQLNYTTITAPIAGRTGLREVDVGNIIHSGDSNGIVVLTQLRPISVVFTLPEQSLGEIQTQQAKAPLKVAALDRDNKTVLDEGNLAVIDNQIDTSTGTIRLKANFPNAQLRLWPGQFVNARLLVSVRTNGLVVPASVIQRGPEGAYAFFVKEDQTAGMTPVKVAQIDQGQALIESGLTNGQVVVVDGQSKVQPGSKVKTAQPGGEGGAGSKKAGGGGAGKGKKAGSTNAPAAEDPVK